MLITNDHHFFAEYVHDLLKLTNTEALLTTTTSLGDSDSDNNTDGSFVTLLIVTAIGTGTSYHLAMISTNQTINLMKTRPPPQSATR